MLPVDLLPDGSVGIDASQTEDLYGFLAAEFSDADFEGKSDSEVIRACVKPTLARWHRQVIEQGRAALLSPVFPWQEVASYANRNLRTPEAVAHWLSWVLDFLEQCLDEASSKGSAIDGN